MTGTIERRLAVMLALAIWGAPLGAQAPSTDVWLAPLTRAGDSLVIGTPRNITNRPGYDNQPSFTPDSRAILFTSVREDAQADIYRFDITTGATTRLTTTPESEYSATVTPDGSSFTVIRVERDSTQRLWRFPLAGGEPSLVLERVKPVGYHAWVDDTTLALFVLGQPATLQVASLRADGARVAARDIGRAIQPASRPGSYSFVQRDSARATTLVIASARDATQTRVPFTGEYHVWTSGLLLASEPTRFRWVAEGELREASTPPWRFSPAVDRHGLRNISRLAVSPDGRWLAFVAEPVAP